jgi:hypothetical protein
MSTRRTGRGDLGRFAEIAERIDMSVEELLSFLDSPAGRRLRHIVATGVILSVPLVMRIPGLRRSPVGRAIELVGGTALLIRLAEAIRDWERGNARRGGRGPVIDVPPAP